MAFCDWLGRAIHLEAAWLAGMEKAYNSKGFVLSELLTTVKNASYADMVSCVERDNLREGAFGEHGPERAVDMVSMCRHGLEMSASEVMGDPGTAMATSVEAALQEYAPQQIVQNRTTPLTFKEHTFPVRHPTQHGGCATGHPDHA